MDIVVIGPDALPLLAAFQRHAQDAGYTVHRFTPRTSNLRLSQPIHGIVFFDDGTMHLPEAVMHVHEQLAFVGVPILLAASRERTGGLQRLVALGECRVVAPEDAQILAEVRGCDQLLPVDAETHTQLVEPFTTAAAQTLAEMAQTEVVLRSAYRKPLTHPMGDIVASLQLKSETMRSLSLGFTEATALALTRLVLGETAHVTDHGMIDDCMGEIANVVAGQAKALLSGSPHRFTFSTPTIFGLHTPRQPDPAGKECLIMAMSCPSGLFAIHLFDKASGTA